MGLDGLSINNLGLNRDSTSKENAIKAEALAESRHFITSSIDQLQKKEAITADDHENPNYSGGSTGDEDEQSEEIQDIYGDNEEAPVGSISEVSANYCFKIDDTHNIIQIIDPENNDIVMQITAGDLSRFVSHLKQNNGIIVNEKV